MNEIKTTSGKAHPLGATPADGGVNFSIYSEKATEIQLLIFDEHHDLEPKYVIDFDPVENRSFHFWHIFVEGIKPGMHYAYRIDGPHDLSQGFRYNKNKVLLDPYSKGNNNHLWDRVAACSPDDNLHQSMRSVIIDHSDYDWEGDESPKFPLQDTIIYEMHVGGFTKDESSGVEHPGTFKGVIEKIPYLKELGITAVELLPVFEFDEKEILRITSEGKPLKNYWGYSTLSFFAPHNAYCVKPEEGSHLDEFRDMVKALHKNGIEVILDVVFNHTNEGNHQGPTINFRGLDNDVYYYLSPENKEFYFDYSGCGNTINANHPGVQKYITDCLEFWVREMHVDGFRFDEGSILTRGEDGSPMAHPPLLWGLELSQIFADTKLIAEAWDAAGLYQIGGFPGYRWGEWNGKYRDAVRSFAKGDPGKISELATRISGSADLYQHSRHSPLNSINFIACHDGFTMMDLVSYNNKNNYANGEDNRDGIDDNISWNSGIEGLTDDEQINKFRKKRIRNFFTLLMLSNGIPMFLSGDEVGKSQFGNNNAYCQDNEISWFDWTLVDRNRELLEFVKKMINFRKDNDSLRRPDFFTGELNFRGDPDISWHGCELNSPGWDDPGSRVLSFTLASQKEGQPDIHVMMNMDYNDLSFELPPDKRWLIFADTAREDQVDDFIPVIENHYLVQQYSIVILINK